MEPHREGQQKGLEPGATPKPKRFRIVKLEERIAPSKGGHKNTAGCNATLACSTECYTQIGTEQFCCG
jgi:hypothetical protein